MTPAPEDRILACLAGGLDLIEDGSRWCRCAAARDAQGYDVLPVSRRAASWCALGAVRRGTEEDFRDARRYLNRAALRLYRLRVASVNDTLGHAAVVRVYRLALKIRRGGLERGPAT